jgi:hypothetical protein
MTTLPAAGNPAGSFSPSVPPPNTSSAGANLVEKIAQFIGRFVFIKERSVYRLLALWVIQTHCYKQFHYTGYVYAHSREEASGKTRLLEVLQLLVAFPWPTSGQESSPTAATIFRTADSHTQFFDEVDTWTDREFLRGILNAGFKKGGVVTRNERKGGQNEYVPKSFPVYCPRAMAGIGTQILHKTTRSRTFLVGMVRQTADEHCERFRPQNVVPESEKLRAEIAAWVKQHERAVVELYNRTGDGAFPYLTGLRDRTVDIAEPLAAILEVAYANTNEVEREREELLEAISVTREDDGKDFVEQHSIVRGLCEVARVTDPLIGNATELAAMLVLTPRPTEHEVSAALRRFGFKNRSMRVGESVRYRYELPLARLEEAVARLDGAPRSTRPPAPTDVGFDELFTTPAPEPDEKDRTWLAGRVVVM